MHDEDFAALPVMAKVVFYTLKLELPASGIGIVNARVIAALVGCSPEELAEALTALDPKWVRRSGSVFWIPNGLRFQPALSPNDSKHRAFVQRQLDALSTSPLAQEFRARYSEWFQMARAPLKGLPGAMPAPPEHIDEDIDEDINETGGNHGAAEGAAPSISRVALAIDEEPCVGEEPSSGKPRRVRSVRDPVESETWLTPYIVAWREAYGGGRMSVSPNAAPLRRLEEQYGPQEVLRRWKLMLAAERAAFANAALLEKGWGDYADAMRSGRGRGVNQPSPTARALYDVMLERGVLACPPDALLELIEAMADEGVFRSAEWFIEVWRRLDLHLLRNARSRAFAYQHIEERAGDLL